MSREAPHVATINFRKQAGPGLVKVVGRELAAYLTNRGKEGYTFAVLGQERKLKIYGPGPIADVLTEFTAAYQGKHGKTIDGFDIVDPKKSTGRTSTADNSVDKLIEEITTRDKQIEILTKRVETLSEEVQVANELLDGNQYDQLKKDYDQLITSTEQFKKRITSLETQVAGYDTQLRKLREIPQNAEKIRLENSRDANLTYIARFSENIPSLNAIISDIMSENRQTIEQVYEDAARRESLGKLINRKGRIEELVHDYGQSTKIRQELEQVYDKENHRTLKLVKEAEEALKPFKEITNDIAKREREGKLTHKAAIALIKSVETQSKQYEDTRNKYKENRDQFVKDAIEIIRMAQDVIGMKDQYEKARSSVAEFILDKQFPIYVELSRKDQTTRATVTLPFNQENLDTKLAKSFTNLMQQRGKHTITEKYGLVQYEIDFANESDAIAEIEKKAMKAMEKLRLPELDLKLGMTIHQEAYGSARQAIAEIPLGPKLLLEIIREAGDAGISPADAHQRLLELGHKRDKQWVRFNLSKLKEKGDIYSNNKKTAAQRWMIA